jgi:hypothetical protein
MVVSVCDMKYANTIPATTPAPARIIASRMTSLRTPRACAPSAMRIPISIDTFVRVGILGRQLLPDRPHLRCDLLERHSRLGAADAGEGPGGALVGKEISRMFERRPQLAILRVREPRGHHADHLLAHTVERDVLADDFRVCAKALLPCRMTQYDHIDIAWLVVFGAEHAAEGGPDAEEVKQAGADLSGGDPDRFSLACENSAIARESGGVRQSLSRFPEVGEIWPGHWSASPLAHVIQRDESLGLVIRQWLEQHPVHHAEYGAVGADAEREREHSHESEARALDEPAHCVTHILAKSVHRDPQAVTKGQPTPGCESRTATVGIFN